MRLIQFMPKKQKYFTNSRTRTHVYKMLLNYYVLVIFNALQNTVLMVIYQALSCINYK